RRCPDRYIERYRLMMFVSTNVMQHFINNAEVRRLGGRFALALKNAKQTPFFKYSYIHSGISAIIIPQIEQIQNRI
ncbi:hypothetical protein KAR91_46120, partial [Candidatus Pacearchaeota archaeon]|nr:hypothetical protein [Candidatus Pacearchaeota archaeon]